MQLLAMPFLLVVDSGKRSGVLQFLVALRLLPYSFGNRRNSKIAVSGGLVVRILTAFRLTLILALIAALLAACSRDPNVRKQKYFASGLSYFQKGKLEEAAIEFRNAVAVDSSFAEAHYELGMTYLKTQQWARANQELGRTIELQPG